MYLQEFVSLLMELQEIKGIYRSLYLSWWNYNKTKVFIGVCISPDRVAIKPYVYIGVCISPDRVAIKPNVFIGVCISPDGVEIKPRYLLECVSLLIE